MNSPNIPSQEEIDAKTAELNEDLANMKQSVSDLTSHQDQYNTLIDSMDAPAQLITGLKEQYARSIEALNAQIDHIEKMGPMIIMGALSPGGGMGGPTAAQMMGGLRSN